MFVTCETVTILYYTYKNCFSVRNVWIFINTNNEKLMSKRLIFLHNNYLKLARMKTSLSYRTTYKKFKDKMCIISKKWTSSRCKQGIWYLCVEAHRVIVGENWEGIIEFSCILLLPFPLIPFIWGGATLVWPVSTYILFVTFHYWHTNGKKLLNLCVHNLSWQHDNSPLRHSNTWFAKLQKWCK